MALNPPRYPEPTPRAIATFDFEDIAEGTGILALNGMDVTDSSGTTFILQRSTLVRAVDGESTTGAERIFNLSQFNFPRFVEGTAYFECAVRAKTDAVSNWTVQLKKFDGSVETDVTSAVTTQDVPASEHDWVSMSLGATTPTHFQKGDILRLSIISSQISALAHQPAGGATSTFAIGSPPASVPSTIMRVLVPLRTGL